MLKSATSFKILDWETGPISKILYAMPLFMHGKLARAVGIKGNVCCGYITLPIIYISKQAVGTFFFWCLQVYGFTRSIAKQSL